jgi:hypothetical protein
MAALKIEILNKKALTLIKGMQDLNLIKITKEPSSQVKEYLKKKRTKNAPSLEEITEIVEKVRKDRYAKK